MTEGAVAAWRLVVQGVLFRGGGPFGGNGGEFVAVFGEVTGNQGLAQLVAGVGIGEERGPEIVVESAVNLAECF